MIKVLICGTRSKIKDYNFLVYKILNKQYSPIHWEGIIEGCCPFSADQYAEEWANENKVKTFHFPATSGNYLKRNIEMVGQAGAVIAFWDGFSYGTAHTISHAVKKGIPVIIIDLTQLKRK